MILANPSQTVHSLLSRRFAYACVVQALLFVPTAGARGQASDLIDASRLGGRGAVLDLPPGVRLDWATGIGDFNGDGFDDIGLGMEEEPGLHPLVIIYGRPGLTGRTPLLLEGSLEGSVVIRGENAGVYVTRSLSAGGDLNGDRLADLLSGFPEYGLELEEARARGIAFIFYGASGLQGAGFVEELGTTVPGVIFFSSNPEHDGIGRVFQNIGDFNGDGRPDLAVSAPLSSPAGRLTAGVVFVVLQSDGLPPRVDLAQVGAGLPGFVLMGGRETYLDGIERVARLGYGIAPAGDVDGDGLADFLVSAAELYPRKVYLIRGVRAPPSVVDLEEAELPQNITVFSSTPPFAESHQFAGIGDLDGDGLGDLLFGLPRKEHEVAHIIYGRPDWPDLIDFDALPPEASVLILPVIDDGDRLSSQFGLHVGPAGDMDRDGAPDFLIGASGTYVRGNAFVGEAYLVLGKRDFGAEVSLAAGFEGIRMLGEGTSDHFGSGVASAGDFNGDGNLDLVVAAVYTDPRMPGNSKVYVIYGSGTSGPPFLVHEAFPVAGSLRGGTKVTLHGSGFTPGAEVAFGGTPAVSVAFVSPTELQAVTAPVLDPGSVDITVTLGAETRTLVGGFEYTPRLPEVDLENLEGRGVVLTGELDSDTGESVAMGDVDGDSVADILVASWRTGAWVVSVVRGGNGLDGEVELLSPSEGVSIVTSSDGRTGAAVAVPGDVNGDGIDDLTISAGGTAGTVGYIIFGRPWPIFPESSSIEEAVRNGGAARIDLPGYRSVLGIAGVGDLTGDGIDDLAIGFDERVVESLDPGGGAILFVEGRRSWPASLDLTLPENVLSRIHGVGARQGLAERFVGVGDVNGDGFGDVLASARGGSGFLSSPFDGWAYLIYGSPELPPEAEVERHIREGGGVAFGFPLGRLTYFHVAGAGDANADGYADVLIGAEGGGVLDEGVTYLVHGSGEFPELVTIPETPVEPDGIVRIIGEASLRQSGKCAPAGDFNADGYDDFIVVTQADPRPVPPARGSVTIIFGGDNVPGVIELRRLGSLGLKLSVPRVGWILPSSPGEADVNGDGRPDFAFTEDREVDRDFKVTPGEQRVYVVFGLGVDAEFRRGDANFDGAINITDAISTLMFLFAGGAAPPCDDAADADDNGRIEITDSVRILNHLFVGNATLPPPFPEEGVDPTLDGARCLGY